MIKGLFAFSSINLYLYLSTFLCLQIFPLLAEQCLKPTWYDIRYNPDFQGYVAENRYEKMEKKYGQKKILYTVFTVESGPAIGFQLFCNSISGKYISKDLPDSYIEEKGKNYYVYDYDKYLIYHNIDDEFLTIP